MSIGRRRSWSVTGPRLCHLVRSPLSRTRPRGRSPRRDRCPTRARVAAQAVERWGTPLYLTDLDAAAANLAAYRDAFPGALIAYAIKANPDPQLLRRFAAEVPAPRSSPPSSWRSLAERAFPRTASS